MTYEFPDLDEKAAVLREQIDGSYPAEEWITDTRRKALSDIPFERANRIERLGQGVLFGMHKEVI